MNDYVLNSLETAFKEQSKLKRIILRALFSCKSVTTWLLVENIT